MPGRFGFTICWKDIDIVHVSWELGKPTTITFRKLSDRRPLKVPPKLLDGTGTFKDVLDFLESRTVPRTRYGLDEILKRYGLADYNPMQMCMQSHGRSMTDFVWLRFDGETITCEDVRLR